MRYSGQDSESVSELDSAFHTKSVTKYLVFRLWGVSFSELKPCRALVLDLVISYLEGGVLAIYWAYLMLKVERGIWLFKGGKGL